jgi:thymidylate kinase
VKFRSGAGRVLGTDASQGGDATLPQLGKRVVLLHGPDDEHPGLSGRDFDYAVRGLDPMWPLRLRREWRLCQVAQYASTGWYWVLERDGAMIALDTVDDPHGIGRDGVPNSVLETFDGPAAPPGLRAAYLTVKRLRKRMQTKVEWNRIGQLAAEDPAGFGHMLEAMVGRRLAARLIPQILARRPPDRTLWDQARTMQFLHRFGTPQRILDGLGREVNRIITRLARPTGLVVLVSGPDGSGKTSLADNLPHLCATLFRRSLRLHWRPGLLPRVGSLIGKQASDPTEPHAQEPHGKIVSIVALLYYWIDFFVGGWAKTRPIRTRTGLVVIERGWWDIAVDPRRYRLDVPKWFVQALGWPLPTPDMALVLECSPDILLARKAEIGRDEVLRQQQAWRHVLPSKVPKIYLDASKPLDVVSRDALRAILRVLEHRAIARLGAGWSGMPTARQPRWILPRGPRAVSRQGLAVYQPMTLRGRIGWEASRVVAGIGGFRALPRGSAPPRPIRTALAPHVPAGGTLAVAKTNFRERFVVLILDPSGNPRTVAKIALDELGTEALSREADAIQRLGSLLEAPLSAPKLIEHTNSMLLLEAVRWQPRWRPWVLDREVAFGMGVFFRSGVSRQDGLRGGTHGDFAPWNLLHTEDDWVIIDWERASSDGFPFADVCHYLIRGHAHLGRPRARPLLRGFLAGEGWVGEAIRAWSDGAHFAATDAPVWLRRYLQDEKLCSSQRIGPDLRRRLLRDLDE